MATMTASTAMYPAYPAPSEKALALFEEMKSFLATEVFPAEEAYARHREEHGHDDHTVPPVVEELKVKAGLSSVYQLAHRRGLAGFEPRPLHP